MGAVASAAWRAAAQSGGAKIRLGIIVGLAPSPEAAIQKVHDLGFPTCQVTPRDTDPAANAGKLRQALDQFNIEATCAVATGPRPEVYDFYQGPATIGLVPREYRARPGSRASKRSPDFAKAAGVPAVQAHCGFIPENPNDPLYAEVVEAIRTVAQYCREQRAALPLRDRAGDNALRCSGPFAM